MAGHNIWSKVKRLKSALDANRGKLFSRLSKEFSFAANPGGGNPRLRVVIPTLRAESCRYFPARRPPRHAAS